MWPAFPSSKYYDLADCLKCTFSTPSLFRLVGQYCYPCRASGSPSVHLTTFIACLVLRLRGNNTSLPISMGIVLPSGIMKPSAFLHDSINGAQSHGPQYPMPTLKPSV